MIIIPNAAPMSCCTPLLIPPQKDLWLFFPLMSASTYNACIGYSVITLYNIVSGCISKYTDVSLYPFLNISVHVLGKSEMTKKPANSTVS
jgi:hypothetical protein